MDKGDDFNCIYLFFFLKFYVNYQQYGQKVPHHCPNRLLRLCNRLMNRNFHSEYLVLCTMVHVQRTKQDNCVRLGSFVVSKLTRNIKLMEIVEFIDKFFRLISKNSIISSKFCTFSLSYLMI